MIRSNEHNKIDLHIHTHYSDGWASPGDIVCKAKELGYEVIAITDHDGAGGVEEAVAAGRKSGLKVIPGIELAAETEEGTGVHILGYGMDTTESGFCEVLARLKLYREDRNEKLVKLMNDMGYEITMEELRKKQPCGYIGKPVIARLLAEKGYISDHKEAFADGKLLESPQAKSIKRGKLKVQEAVNLIKKAGGTAVMAHPIQTRGIGEPGSEAFYNNIDKLIRQFAEYGLEGLECYHPDQDTAQTERFIAIARKYDLKITRGSDFHGPDFAYADETASWEEIGIPPTADLV